ncbi:MAG TPA: OsmC family protein [Mucilaginibacter sp.]|jgi:uncharacterized OsmC-like protein
MATIHTTYLGGLRTEATHLQSGTKIITDAPTDNKGKGESFSPTDLLAESLAGCMLTTMGIAADVHGIDINGTECEVTKVMAANPRRVAEVVTILKFPKQYTEKEKEILKKAALGCPVAVSLHPDVVKTVNFGWD